MDSRYLHMYGCCVQIIYNERIINLISEFKIWGEYFFLIIDMQNGFINNYTQHLVERIHDFQADIADHMITAGTRYVNHEQTACYLFEGWKSCMAGSEEAEVVPELRGYMQRVFDKDKYSCWNEEMKAFIRDNTIEKYISQV